MKKLTLYWVSTGEDYLQIIEAYSPNEAAKKAFYKKEPKEAGLITEVKSFENNDCQIFYIDTVNIMKSIGFRIGEEA
jgi:hypothetical protein